MPGSMIFPSMSEPGAICGTKVPSLNAMPNHSPSVGNSLRVALVSGSCRLIEICPRHFEMTIDQKTVAIEVNELARSVWVVQIRSTNGDSDRLSSKWGNMHPILY